MCKRNHSLPNATDFQRLKILRACFPDSFGLGMAPRGGGWKSVAFHPACEQYPRDDAGENFGGWLSSFYYSKDFKLLQ